MHARSLSARALLTLLVVVLAFSLSACTLASTDGESGGIALSEPAVAPSYDMDESIARDQASGMSPDELAKESYGTGTDAADVPAADRLVVLTAGLRIDVDDVESAADTIRSSAQDIGGIVTNVQISSEDEIPVYRYDAVGSLADGAALSGYITVRVPSESYDAFLLAVRDVGSVIRQSESEQDVTQEHIDLSARLLNLQAQEQRLREFNDQAKNVEELLQIEQELTRVRAEIDSLSGQLAYLERQAAMSVVTIELVGPRPVVRPQGENWGFTDALTQSVRAFVGTINVMIVLAGALLPVAIAVLVLAFVIRAIVRSRRKTPSSAEEIAEP